VEFARRQLNEQQPPATMILINLFNLGKPLKFNALVRVHTFLVCTQCSNNAKIPNSMDRLLVPCILMQYSSVF
jgi:hypothetical protein